jgi:hypothetical protein
MNYAEAKAKSRTPEAFTPGDRWMVKNSQTGEPLESAHTEARAQTAADICNEHEEKNNRPRVYVVEMLE